MKKTIFNIILITILSVFVFSCNNTKEVKKATDIKSLKEKYNIKFIEFKDCEEFANAYEESMNIYFDKLEQAPDLNLIQEDEEFKELNIMISYVFDLQMEKYSQNCEKFDSINKALSTRYQALQVKIMQQQQQMQEMDSLDVIDDDTENSEENLEDLPNQ